MAIDTVKGFIYSPDKASSERLPAIRIYVLGSREEIQNE